jgi:hypothetical protein
MMREVDSELLRGERKGAEKDHFCGEQNHAVFWRA